MIGMYNDKYIEEMAAILAILSQINGIIESFYLDNESDIKKHYCWMRKRILDFLDECIAKTEVDDQQEFYFIENVVNKWMVSLMKVVLLEIRFS